ncbi:MAG: VOC family protein [Gammaproteobacteria bacterium]|nr:VOC family protein [Gammaproteobacteria bacterium]NIR83485.1 VOC family protein [Gammaproteobacteria bacterium]NIR91407.1 VOC family protein [Gammaproteobacteria bacterium]NIU04647.1 VOC family protein [Gammaproteobacteria bacterium]NIV51689.1 VOC family protein [Gammaproteobacteria bacterium]
MHHSRLCGFIIDCRTDDLQREAKFWSEALGFGVHRSSDPDDANYLLLDAASRDLEVELQQVAHASRVHLDIEADDVEAEVHRLEKLGAKRLQQVRTWWVMEAPSGHRFCVVPARSAHFSASANEWD